MHMQIKKREREREAVAGLKRLLILQKVTRVQGCAQCGICPMELLERIYQVMTRKYPFCTVQCVVRLGWVFLRDQANPFGCFAVNRQQVVFLHKGLEVQAIIFPLPAALVLDFRLDKLTKKRERDRVEESLYRQQLIHKGKVSSPPFLFSKYQRKKT